MDVADKPDQAAGLEALAAIDPFGSFMSLVSPSLTPMGLTTNFALVDIGSDRRNERPAFHR